MLGSSFSWTLKFKIFGWSVTNFASFSLLKPILACSQSSVSSGSVSSDCSFREANKKVFRPCALLITNEGEGKHNPEGCEEEEPFL
jgi:hypothetical protein